MPLQCEGKFRMREVGEVVGSNSAVQSQACNRRGNLSRRGGVACFRVPDRIPSTTHYPLGGFLAPCYSRCLTQLRSTSAMNTMIYAKWILLFSLNAIPGGLLAQAPPVQSKYQ